MLLVLMPVVAAVPYCVECELLCWCLLPGATLGTLSKFPEEPCDYLRVAQLSNILKKAVAVMLGGGVVSENFLRCQ